MDELQYVRQNILKCGICPGVLLDFLSLPRHSLAPVDFQLAFLPDVVGVTTFRSAFPLNSIVRFGKIRGDMGEPTDSKYLL